MQLMLDGQRYTCIPLPNFRLQQGLPDDFSVAYFEPKNWEGLGSISGSGKVMASMKQSMLEAIPQKLNLSDLIPLGEALTNLFHQEFVNINSHIGLQEVEVEFAVAGFADILRGVAFKLIQLSQAYENDLAEVRQNFDFEPVYQAWLDDSTRLSSIFHLYTHGDTAYQAQVIYNPYGRVGLKVQTNGQTYYTADMGLACPAASYMEGVCGEVALKICAALIG